MNAARALTLAGLLLVACGDDRADPAAPTSEKAPAMVAPTLSTGWRISYAMVGEPFKALRNDGNLDLTVPDGLIWLRGEYDGELSGLFGIAWPEIPSCWDDPYNFAPASGAWRMTANHKGRTLGYPDATRDELNGNGWTLQRASSRDVWVRFEKWGTGRYDAASPWFRLRFRVPGHRTDELEEAP